MQLIDKFRNTKLSIKFLIIFLLLGLGFIFMGSTYYETIRAHNIATKKNAELNYFGDLVDQIRINILEANKYVTNFEITQDLKALDLFNNEMTQIDNNITEIRALMRTDEERKFISSIEVLLDDFQNAFYAATEVAIELGLTDNQGLFGDFNQKMDVIESIAIKTKDEKLTEKFLALRQLQTSYLKIKDTKITADEVIVAQKNFLDRVNRSEGDYTQVSKMMVQTISLMQSFKILQASFEEEKQLFKQSDEKRLKLQPVLKQLVEISEKYKQEDQQAETEFSQQILKLFISSIVLVIITFIIAVFVLKRSILKPIMITQQTIAKVTSGEIKARSHLKAEDELGSLATALDNLLDEKVSALAEKQAENEKINDSMIAVVQSVFQLSQRDLTIRVPVAEDLTGALADSINLLTDSMERVLKNVHSVSERVMNASEQVKSQSETVKQFADKDQVELKQTLQELDAAVFAMKQISQLAKISNNASLKAIKTSAVAEQSVRKTIESINIIRDTIHQAEKKIKRLGERSQEIGGIVSLINNISERTHLLSLNASMHAAAAGEAGKGLMVVVDEVQRLAENSREATAEITSLVNNIQLETADTINVMNTVISNVVAGTKLAKQAGERMQETRATTEALVKSVDKISKNSVNQEKVAEGLLSRATVINESSKSTHQQMGQQTELSNELVKSAQELQTAISVFKLANAA